jgi:anti-anti-sigma factor
MQDGNPHTPPADRGDPTIEVRHPQRGVTEVALIGEYDLDTVAVLEHALNDAIDQSSHLIVDLARAEYIDSTTIQALMSACRRAGEAGVKFNLRVGRHTVVRRALEITDVLGALNAVD